MTFYGMMNQFIVALGQPPDPQILPQYETHDLIARCLVKMHHFNINNKSKHHCCSSKTTYELEPDLKKDNKELLDQLANNSAQANMPLEIEGSYHLQGSTKSTNCCESHDFNIKFHVKINGHQEKLHFLKVRKAPKCICGSCGWSRVCTVIDTRENKFEELGEFRKQCGVCNYTLEVWVKDRLRYYINTKECDCTCCCCRCGTISFEIIDTGDKGNEEGDFSKVTNLKSS